MASISRPQRGTRPANRHALIVAAAAELFHARGYEHVAMSDVADAVAVCPSALYRHVPSKQQLLKEVIFDNVAVLKRALDGADLTEPRRMYRVAELTVTNRHVGILWERESRHLPESDQLALHTRSQQISGRLARLVATARPDLTAASADLLARIVLGILISSSFYRSDLSIGEQSTLLAEMATRVIEARLPNDYGLDTAPTRGPGLLPQSRREALLQQAIRLFAERRYASVGIEEVAASIGIAGPSVYNHFASKAELLVTALERGNAYLYTELSDVLDAADDSASALSGLLVSYTRFGFAHPALVDILLAEMRNLPEPRREIMMNAQREYVNEWVHLLRAVRGGVSAAQARAQVQAVLSVINYISRIRHLRTANQAQAALVRLCGHILNIEK